jgi:hypothetical protein
MLQVNTFFPRLFHLSFPFPNCIPETLLRKYALPMEILAYPFFGYLKSKHINYKDDFYFSLSQSGPIPSSSGETPMGEK